MPRHVHQRITICHYLQPFVGQLVDDIGNSLFIARNGPTGEDNHITSRQRDLTVLITGNACHCGTRFALRPSAKSNNLITRQRSIGLFITEWRQSIKIAQITRDLDSALHAPANHNNLTLCRHCRFCNRAHTRNVGGKRGHSNAVRCLFDNPCQLFLHIRFTGADPVTDCIGAVTDKDIHAFISQFTQTLKVNRFTNARCQIDLPVTGMQHQLTANTNSQSTRLRDRVGHGHHLNIKDTGFETISLINNSHRNFIIRTIANQLGFQKASSELGRVDR